MMISDFGFRVSDFRTAPSDIRDSRPELPSRASNRAEICLLTAVALLSGSLLRAETRLEFADHVRMVSCEPASRVPCFRLKASLVDAQGTPVAAEVPAGSDVVQYLTVRFNGQEYAPFYATTGSGEGTGEVRRRMALILMDVSGSMREVLPGGQTRFAAARSAAAEFLRNFESGVDRVAVVPFGSRNVISTIRSARFATTSDEALRQIQSLPDPLPTSNTALYSAVATGIDVLIEQGRVPSSSTEAVLVVMTDGKNFVRQGDDDPGLLEGPAGLQQVAEKVRAMGIQVLAIGLGDHLTIDQAAMRQISTKLYMVQDIDALKHAFFVARGLFINRIQATVASPWEDRASLAGKSLRIQLVMRLPGGQQIETPETVWSAPQIGLPIYEGNCDSAEMKAFLDVHKASSAAEWLPLVRPILVFLALGTILLILWFWIPRLVWADQYVGDLRAIHGGARWQGEGAGSRQERMPGRPAPPGFDKAGGARPPLKRDPGDLTIRGRIGQIKDDRRD
ncbi:MAG: vWA domain-containing protein [Acidobacteriota bacterium]